MTSSDTDPTDVVEKRIRKSVQRLSEDYNNVFDTNKDRKAVKVDGSGVRLGDIQRVKDAFHRGKIDKAISRNIHLLCYKTFGQAGKRNTEIRKFNGFNKDDENEIRKRVMLSEKLKLGSLKLICDLFNIPTTGKQKKNISVGLVEYLKCPIESGSLIFRTSALRHKTKTKSTKNNKKELKTKKDKSVGDKKMTENGSELSSISVFDSDSEQIIIPKTKRLENKNSVLDEKEDKGKEEIDMESKDANESTQSPVKTKESEEKAIEKDVEADKDTIDTLERKDSQINDTDTKEKEVKAQKEITKKVKKVKIVNENIDVHKSKKSDNKNGKMVTKETGAPKDKKVKLNNDTEEVPKVRRPKKKKMSEMVDVSSSKFNISDAKLKSKIFEILKDADLSTTTLNHVCDKVTAQFPDADLVTQRHHIKELVKEVIDEN